MLLVHGIVRRGGRGFRSVLQLLGRGGDVLRQWLVLGRGQQFRQSSRDLDVDLEIHAAGNEASGQQARHLFVARESTTGVADEALLLGPAAELERHTVTMSLGNQAQQILVFAVFVQENRLARSRTAIDAAKVAAREATNAIGVLQVARIDGAAAATARVDIGRVSSLEVFIDSFRDIGHFHVSFQGRQLHDQFDAAALAIAVQSRGEVNQFKDVIGTDQADIIIASNGLACIRSALEATDLAPRLETKASWHFKVVKAESTASNLDEVVRDGLFLGEVNVVILESTSLLQSINSFLHTGVHSLRVVGSRDFFVLGSSFSRHFKIIRCGNYTSKRCKKIAYWGWNIFQTRDISCVNILHAISFPAVDYYRCNRPN